MRYTNKRLLNDYVKYELGVIACREEKRLREDLGIFLEFLEDNSIKLKDLKDLKDMEKSNLVVEYFILLREIKADNEEAINRHMRTIKGFLNYLEVIGFIELKGKDDRVKEAPGLYVCA